MELIDLLEDRISGMNPLSCTDKLSVITGTSNLHELQDPEVGHIPINTIVQHIFSLRTNHVVGQVTQVSQAPTQFSVGKQFVIQPRLRTVHKSRTGIKE